MIVAVISEKGGTGKTTIAIHLAGWRKAAGSDVMLVDGDRQGTATYWVEVRGGLGLPSPLDGSGLPAKPAQVGDGLDPALRRYSCRRRGR